MKILKDVVTFTLALSLPLGGCSAFPDTSITSSPSPNTSIIYEKVSISSTSSQQSRSLKIQSDVPLTIQRYDQSEGASFTHPILPGDEVILVTSTCDTSDTKVQPVVEYEKGEKGEIVSVNIKVGVSAEEASQMPFSQPSSYNAVWYESGGGMFTKTNKPTKKPTTSNLVDPGNPIIEVESTVCLTSKECEEMGQKMGMGSFLKGDFPSKGCFSKNNIAYWDGSGSADDKSQESLPGMQERIWCEKEVVDQIIITEEAACISKDECDQKRLGMGIETFLVGEYPSKGCFSKNGVAYWGKGGTDEDRSRSDLSGIQERIWCDEIVGTTVTKCETGPAADPAKLCGSGQYCQLDMGVCNNKSGKHSGICKDVTGDACIELWQPVCGCDGNTYGNTCKASSKGINLSREDECEEILEEEACLTADECDTQRQKMNYDDFLVDVYPSKGCFSKNGVAYFSTGNVGDMSKATLPGIQERIWCTKKRGSNINPALQQSNSNTVSQGQHESETSSACSLRSFMLGSLLHNTFSAKVSGATPATRARALDTCVYNAEILLNGCSGSCTPTSIEVSAPKARVINSDLENQKQEIFDEYETFQDGDIQYYMRDYKNYATLIFQEKQAVDIGVSADGYSDVPPLDSGTCCEIVVGRPFVDSKGNSLLASSFSTDECDNSIPWLGEASVSIKEQTPSIKNITGIKDLEEEWTKSALGEHASVASFAAFSIALMTNHAPSNLIEDSLKAALDEVRHAKVSFEIASKLMGKQVSPGPLPPSSLEFNHDLTALAVSLAKEGCVDETLSALAAAAEVELIDEVLEYGTEEGAKYFGLDSELLLWIRNELHTISVDESRHSALAWRTLNWVCTLDTKACDAAKHDVLDESKLIMAFQRRFGAEFVEKSDLLKRMTVAWTRIYTSEGVLHSDIHGNGDGVWTLLCVDDAHGGKCIS